MKELSLYSIRDMALETGRAVFSVQQLSNLTGRSKEVSRVYLSRLVIKGLARRLLEGKISFVEDDFVIATQLIEPSYISLDSALLAHGVINQVPKYIECVTTLNSIRYRSLGIRYHKIPGAMLSGFKREGKGSSYIFLAEAEKAFIDGIYLNIYSEKTIAEHLDAVNVQRMHEIADGLNVRGAERIKKVIESLARSSY